MKAKSNIVFFIIVFMLSFFLVDDHVVFHEPTALVDRYAVVACRQYAEVGGVIGPEGALWQFFHELFHP